MATVDGTTAKIPTAEPNNLDAEGAVLGAIIADNSLMEILSGTIQAIDFYDPLHRDMYAAMAEMIGADRRADLVTLVPIIRGKKIGDIDAESYLRLLPKAAPRSRDELNDYVTEVLRYSAQRGVMHTAKKLAHDAGRHGVDLVNLFSDAIKDFDTALARQRTRSISIKPMGEFADDALAAYDKGESGIPTGLIDFDRQTGGLFRGELSYLGGRPGTGKTTIACEIGLNVARAGYGVGMISLEMDGEPLATRFLSSMAYSEATKIPYEKFRKRTLTPDDIETLRGHAEVLKQYPFVVEQQAGLNMAQIMASCRRIQDICIAKGQPLGLIILDYIGLVGSSGRWTNNRVAELGEISVGLKQLSKALNVHVMALTQLNRAVESREDKRPQLHDMRESGSLEQDADLVIFAYREEYYLERQGTLPDAVAEAERQAKLAEWKNILEIMFAKQRMGEVGSKKFFCSVANNKVADLLT